MRLLVSLYIISAATLAATRPVPLAATVTAAATAPELETGQRTEESKPPLHSDFIEKGEFAEELKTEQKTDLNFMARAQKEEDDENAKTEAGNNEATEPDKPTEKQTEKATVPHIVEDITVTVSTSSSTTEKSKKKGGGGGGGGVIVIIVVVVLCCVLIICLPLICLCTGCCGLALSPCLACLMCGGCCGGDDEEGGGCCGGGGDDDGGGCCGGGGDDDGGGGCCGGGGGDDDAAGCCGGCGDIDNDD